MNVRYSNPCVRCGTERIVLKTWKERVGNSIVTNTKTICPNPECQKKVDNDNKRQRNRYIAIKLKSEKRLLHRNKIRYLQKEKAKKVI